MRSLDYKNEFVSRNLFIKGNSVRVDSPKISSSIRIIEQPEKAISSLFVNDLSNSIENIKSDTDTLSSSSLPIMISSNSSFPQIKSSKWSKAIESVDKSVFIHGDFPRKMKTAPYRKVFNEINTEMLRNWVSIDELKSKDVDIHIYFENYPDETTSEIIYRIFIMDLTKNELELIWLKLRVLFDRITDRMKRAYPKYRKTIERFSELVSINVEW